MSAVHIAVLGSEQAFAEFRNMIYGASFKQDPRLADAGSVKLFHVSNEAHIRGSRFHGFMRLAERNVRPGREGDYAYVVPVMDNSEIIQALHANDGGSN